MPDLIHAEKIAAVALGHVQKAAKAAEGSRYSDKDVSAVQSSLAVASELLALIAEPDRRGGPEVRFVNEAGVPVYPPPADPAPAPAPKPKTPEAYYGGEE